MKKLASVVMGAWLAVSCAPAAYGPAHAPAPDSVSIGYGTRARSETTGAVQVVKADAHGSRYATVLQMLQGRVAGLQVVHTPDGQIALRLRGPSSLSGGNEPLLVVDGHLISPEGVGSALLALMPSEVERIDVLKDAGSAAIYGVRGSNGVIAIRTKRAS